jgi:hypothetical protein
MALTAGHGQLISERTLRLEHTVLVNVRLPSRPEPTDPRARQVIEWAEVIYYIFWLAFSAVAVVRALELYAPALLK